MRIFVRIFLQKVRFGRRFDTKERVGFCGRLFRFYGGYIITVSSLPLRKVNAPLPFSTVQCINEWVHTQKTPTFRLVFFYFLYLICVRLQWVGEQKQLIIIFAKPKPPKATSRQRRVYRGDRRRLCERCGRSWQHGSRRRRKKRAREALRPPRAPFNYIST